MTRGPEEDARSVNDTQTDGPQRDPVEAIESTDRQEGRLGSRSEGEEVVPPLEAKSLSCDQGLDAGMPRVRPDVTDLGHDSLQDHLVRDDRPDPERKEQLDQERIGP
ncbi:hypothetical protein PHYPSEUDO_000286 [Phytophthora pseudosyringae]|uniref:Uncharacterized protein n=1 Tax=Phytophthora pseudosyringae TaxID=221518 RepID=A0A8T1V3P1_9STRA|nr:hypothetical protein PHYPSEUDO_000286 [Phytophthora pseudosyringae]